MILARKQGGFTIVEILIALLLLGALGAIVGSYMGVLGSIKTSGYVLQQNLNNEAISRAMVDASLDGLPDPYTGAGFTSTIYDPASADADDLALGERIAANRVSQLQINTDGFASQRVRVYQKVSDLTHDLPLFGLAGELVPIKYDYGVIYMTACAKSDATCNPTPATGLPGDSPKIDDSNYTTWKVAGSDRDAVRFSNLSLQRSRLVQTVQRINELREKMRIYFNALQVSGAPGSDQNYFPAPGSSGAPNFSGSVPSTNQDCHDGWYTLGAANVDVVEQLGLSKGEYATTLWGASIEYCRDYNPSATGVADEGNVPHAGALRINRDVTSGSSPSSTAANNVIFSF